MAQGGRMVAEPVAEEILKLGVKATAAMGLDYAGVDIIESERGPVVLGVDSSPGWQTLKEATGIDIAEKIVRYATAKR